MKIFILLRRKRKEGTVRETGCDFSETVYQFEYFMVSPAWCRKAMLAR